MTLSERADACLAALDNADQAIARRLFLRLVGFSDGRAGSHPPQPLRALRASEPPAQLDEILRRFTEAGVLTSHASPGEPMVDLAHDSVTAWPPLQAWIHMHGRAEQQRRQLERSAAAWRQHADQGTDLGLLDSDQLSELGDALTDGAHRDLGISETAASFLTASRAAARPRWWPGRASPGSLLAVLLVLMLLATPVILLFVVVLSASVIHVIAH